MVITHVPFLFDDFFLEQLGCHCFLDAGAMFDGRIDILYQYADMSEPVSDCFGHGFYPR